MRGALPEVRWTQVETLFLEAAEMPPGERKEFLQRRCGGDSGLREEVLSLLQYDTREASTLIDALQTSAANVVGDDLAAGRMMGPYRIEHEIGRGGMAVVYLAVRADGEFRKRVAIKLIKRGMDTEAVVERLRRERRILAALEHLCADRSGAARSPVCWMEEPRRTGGRGSRWSTWRGFRSTGIARNAISPLRNDVC